MKMNQRNQKHNKPSTVSFFYHTLIKNIIHSFIHSFIHYMDYMAFARWALLTTEFYYVGSVFQVISDSNSQINSNFINV